MRPQFKSPSWPLQQEIYKRLTTHSAMVSQGYDKIVFDFVDQKQPMPYIKIGIDYSDEWGSRDIAGMVFVYPIDIFDDSKIFVGKKKCKLMADAVIQAISSKKIDLSSYGFSVAVQIFSGLRFLEEDGKDSIVYHGIAEHTYKIQPI